MLIDIIIISSILDKYYTIDDNTINLIILIYNNLYNPNYSIFHYYEILISSLKYIDLKKKVFKDILPILKAKCEE